MNEATVPANQERKPNRLVDEKSPYLQQHAFNPVDWNPWDEVAFDRAMREQKPIFLSIGYSTCHWCHVMERESFENESIAAILNRHFVSIKVDREERPDVDKVYMAALQGMGQGGGWPLSMFLTPDRRPFYGGTYFPPETRYGRIGFSDLLRRINEIWETEKDKVLASAEGITEFLRRLPVSMQTTRPEESAFEKCFEQIGKSYDPRFGGFGEGPKFPRPVVFNFLLRYYSRTGNQHALDMTAHTLRQMYEGGIYDQIGDGFHRYSVDGEWRVPHFEKMLYDQAQLVTALVDLFLMTEDRSYSRIIRGILDYVARDLSHPEGGFYSAEDADSPRPDARGEEGEGAFYVWTKKELIGILGPHIGEIYCTAFGAEEAGNVPVDPQHEFTGRNILYVARPVKDLASAFHEPEERIIELLSEARRMLFEVRAQRPRPRLDDKILTSWNGLMISAFARAFQALEDETYLERAAHAAGFILARMYDNKTGELVRRYRDGEAKFEAHLDDYAFFTQSLLDLYEASGDSQWLESAVLLNRKAIELFWDEVHGCFFDTSGRDRSVLVRTRELYDGAEPSGTSIATMNLLRLSQMTDNEDWRKKAEQVILSVGEVLNNQPSVMPQMVCALDFLLSKPRQVVIAGATGDAETRSLVKEVFRRYNPNRVILYAGSGEKEGWLVQHVPFIRELSMLNGEPTAYICRDYVCDLPTSDPEVVAQILDRKD